MLSGPPGSSTYGFVVHCIFGCIYGVHSFDFFLKLSLPTNGMSNSQLWHSSKVHNKIMF